jgi:hypothetical protein
MKKFRVTEKVVAQTIMSKDPQPHLEPFDLWSMQVNEIKENNYSSFVNLTDDI